MGLSIGIGIPSGILNSNQGGGGDTTSFITTWRTTTPNESITIPTTGGGYNYDLTTSDGQSFTSLTGSKTITFTSAGDYDVSISGDFPRIYINNNATNRVKLIDIKQWGNIVWSSFDKAFYGCSNLTGSFTDVPNLTNVVWLRSAFSASSFNGDINGWDVSNVTNMFGVFSGNSVFNQPLNNWNIISVDNFTHFSRSVTFSTTNYDAILIGWEATLQAAYPNGTGYTPTISINFGGSKYTGGGAAATARASLVSNFGWSLVDGGTA